jgi:HD superfamily phosphohydrolase
LPDEGYTGGNYPKVINDPVWGTIELFPWEIVLLDSPLMQRLRGVRQLGLAHFVYPSACHDRLEHARGVVEAADRMLQRLHRNAQHRRTFGHDMGVPSVQDEDRYIIRLAALLHDSGHGPFSHAIEPLIEQRYRKEFKALQRVAAEDFSGVGEVSVSEAIAVLMVLSPSFGAVLNHNGFSLPYKTNAAVRIAARIVGSRTQIHSTFLSGIVSGPIDADKLDYMARDAHHAGLPLKLDTDRLISKLEILVLTEANCPPKETALLDRIRTVEGKRVYQMGISISGIAAYEQMIAARLLLYDKVYFHQKVRCADAMAQRLVKVAEIERGKQFTVTDFFGGFSDDTMIWLLGGQLKGKDFRGGKKRAQKLAERISNRTLYHRAVAVASRFIGGFDHFNDPTLATSERAALWSNFTRELSSFDAVYSFEEEIFNTAKEIGAVVVELKDMAELLQRDDLIVDMPPNKSRLGSHLLFTHTEDDRVGLPNLYFNPERWSEAYELQKRSAYVFCTKEVRTLVGLATRVTLFRKFRLALNDASASYAKVAKIKPEWIDTLKSTAVIDAECAIQLKDGATPLQIIQSNDLRLPSEWVSGDPNLPQRLAQEIREARPGGLPLVVRTALVSAIFDVAAILNAIVKDGSWRKLSKIAERDMQTEMLKLLRAREVRAIEGSKVGGGETDVIVYDNIVIENKVAKKSDDPMSVGVDYPFQARRYAISLCQSAFITFVAYSPKSEAGLLPQNASVRAKPVLGVPGDFVEIRFVVPYGFSKPSRASSPK